MRVPDTRKPALTCGPRQEGRTHPVPRNAVCANESRKTSTSTFEGRGIEGQWHGDPFLLLDVVIGLGKIEHAVPVPGPSAFSKDRSRSHSTTCCSHRRALAPRKGRAHRRRIPKAPSASGGPSPSQIEIARGTPCPPHGDHRQARRVTCLPSRKANFALRAGRDGPRGS